MHDSTGKLILKAAGFGLIAGLRSMMAPALYSRYAAAQRPAFGANDTPGNALNTPNAANILRLMAAGELIADKLPFTPSRTMPASVIFRAASGALVGAALFADRKRSPLPGALIGAAAAIAATYGAYHLRQAADKKSGLPDPVIALVEDAIAVGGGHLLLQN